MLDMDTLVRSFNPPKDANYRLLVGFEYEVALFDRSNLMPLGYDGASGLREILYYIAETFGGERPSGEPPNMVGFADGSQISLEPGGQFEYSSAPQRTFSGCMHQLHTFLRTLHEIGERFGVHAFFGGVNPIHTVEQIGLVVPKKRYQIMDEYLRRAGSMGQRMMRQTCSLQVTFDYGDVALGQQLLRAGSIVAPLAAGLLSNAPFVDGRATGFRSYRVPIWLDTDNPRCGPLPGICDQTYSFEDYVRYVLDAPMFMISTDGDTVPISGLTFATFNREGLNGRKATLDDFQLHNSTMFNDVRLKKTIEIRSVDAQDPKLVPGALALLCGLLMCEVARKRTLQAVAPLDCTLQEIALAFGRNGIKGTIGGVAAHELALWLIDAAAEGLLNCFPDGRDAVAYLDPLRDLATKRMTPADIVNERFSGDPHRWLAAGRTFNDNEF